MEIELDIILNKFIYNIIYFYFFLEENVATDVLIY